MQSLVDNGLAAEASHIIICLSSDLADVSWPVGLFREASELVHDLIPAALIIPSAANTFEYPALYQVWQMSRFISADDSHQHLILYFHSKGMVNGGAGVRTAEERELFARIIHPWRHVVAMFSVRDDIDKLGLTGWQNMVWVNFFWARVSVIQRLVQPIIHPDRYYFEHWLGAWNGSMLGISKDDPRVLPDSGSVVITADGSIHIPDDCSRTMSVWCSNASHAEYYVVGQCVDVDSMIQWQGGGGWNPERRPLCDCHHHECGLLTDFT